MKEVKSVAFDKYKSFPKGDTLYEIPLEPYVTVLIGKNNCGKSSCIDVLEGALKKNSFLHNKNIFSSLSVSFSVTDKDVVKWFDHSRSGGDGISGNHYVHGKNYVNKLIYGELNRKYENREYTISLNLNDQKNEIGLPAGKNSWTNLLNSYSKYQDTIDFRRINADRDIVPEMETKSETLSDNGDGATNLLRMFVNHSDYNEKLVENVLLTELNKIMEPDSNFKNIRVQQIDSGEDLLWEIFLEEDNSSRFALSKSGSGLKTIILLLINLYIVPSLKQYKDKEIVFAFEELENNLHPALQRKVFEYLYDYAKEKKCHVFITTHSHIAINTYADKDNTAIYHIIKENNKSSIRKVECFTDKIEVLNDLDVKASDLFQSNGIIWVEGPSDRIYINKWLKEFCDCKFLEGSNYQYLYYGGKVLSHYTADSQFTNDLISIITTNKNCAIVIDSDCTSKKQNINNTKCRIAGEFKNINAFCWITAGKEIENYLPADAINKKYNTEMKQVKQFGKFPNYIKAIDKNFASHKVIFAKEISDYINNANSKDILDLQVQIKKLYSEIEKWNKK